MDDKELTEINYDLVEEITYIRKELTKYQTMNRNSMFLIIGLVIAVLILLFI